jgi:hypothetical protein
MPEQDLAKCEEQSVAGPKVSEGVGGQEIAEVVMDRWNRYGSQRK